MTCTVYLKSLSALAKRTLAAPAFPKIEEDAQKLAKETVTCPASEAANKKKVVEELTNSVKAVEALETELQQELKGGSQCSCITGSIFRITFVW